MVRNAAENPRAGIDHWLAVAGIVLLAGCTGDLAGDEAQRAADLYDSIEAAIGTPIEGDHNHADGTLHTGRYNLDRVALATGRGSDGYGELVAGDFFAETAVKGGYAYLTRYGQDSGLVVFDVQDVERPQLVGSVRLEAGFEPDIEVSDDGRWAFWLTQRFPLSVQKPSLDPGANAPRGIHIVDLSDKSAPRWANFVPVWPDGPHSITYANVGGRHILFQSVYAFTYAYKDVEIPGAQRLVVSELDTTLPVPTLRELATYVEPGTLASGTPGLFPHDVSVQRHPVTGHWLAYVAYWDLGVVILDVSDPARPVKVGQAIEFGPAQYKSIHMARPFPHLIDGRHVTVAEPELGAAPDSGYITFLDTTDPTAPRYVSSWKVPGELPGQARFSPHYFDLRDGRVAMANYHAGVWVVDVHDEANLARPRSVAFAESERTPAAPIVDPFASTEFTWGTEPLLFDAWWADPSHIVAGDVFGGLAVYRYLGPAAPPA